MPGTVSEVSATLVASTTRRAMTAEHALLFLGRKPRIQRQNLSVRRMMLAQRLGSFADLALAWQKHQDVALPRASQLVDRVDERLNVRSSTSSARSASISGR